MYPAWLLSTVALWKILTLFVQFVWDLITYFWQFLTSLGTFFIILAIFLWFHFLDSFLEVFGHSVHCSFSLFSLLARPALPLRYCCPWERRQGVIQQIDLQLYLWNWLYNLTYNCKLFTDLSCFSLCGFGSLHSADICTQLGLLLSTEALWVMPAWLCSPPGWRGSREEAILEGRSEKHFLRSFGRWFWRLCGLLV